MHLFRKIKPLVGKLNFQKRTLCEPLIFLGVVGMRHSEDQPELLFSYFLLLMGLGMPSTKK